MIKYSGIFITVVGILLMSQSFADKDYSALRDECLQLHNLTHKDFEDMDVHLPSEDVNENVKCFAFCLMKELEFLDADGKLSEGKLNEEGSIGEEEMLKIMECKAEHDLEDDPCEYAYAMMSCVM